MLEDEYREHGKISSEYQKLLVSWNREQINNPSSNIKRSKINKSEHAQFTLIHLFNDYLNQIWSDSQNIIECAESWANKNKEMCPADIAFTMNIHGLHLMKQSLRKRQQLFRIVDDLNSIYLTDNEKSDSSLCSSSDSTIIHDYSAHHSDQQKIEMDTVTENEKEFDNYFDLNLNGNISTETGLTRPIRLRSSPSTPTIGNLWEDSPVCSQNFTPGCNYSTYFPRDSSVQKPSCHFCQKIIPFKKSFSVENIHSFHQRISTITDDDDGSINDKDSSFDVLSFYRYGEKECEISKIKRDILDSNEEVFINEQYQQLNDSEGSQKIEIENDGLSLSSSISHSILSRQELNRRKKASHQSTDASSTYLRCSTSSKFIMDRKKVSSSTKYSLEEIHKINNNSNHLSNNSSQSSRMSKNKIDTSSIPRLSEKRKTNIKLPIKMSRSSSSIVRSFSGRNINLCNMFSTRKQNNTTSINKISRH